MVRVQALLYVVIKQKMTKKENFAHVELCFKVLKLSDEEKRRDESFTATAVTGVTMRNKMTDSSELLTLHQ